MSALLGYCHLHFLVLLHYCSTSLELINNMCLPPVMWELRYEYIRFTKIVISKKIKDLV
jgi:hypothetical protein